MNKLLNAVVVGIAAMALSSFVLACSSPLDSNKDNAAKQGARSLGSPSAPALGAAASFAVFGGGAGITNAGTNTLINGDMGTTGASTMITGFHSSVFSYAETPEETWEIIQQFHRQTG